MDRPEPVTALIKEQAEVHKKDAGEPELVSFMWPLIGLERSLAWRGHLWTRQQDRCVDLLWSRCQRSLTTRQASRPSSIGSLMLA